MKPPSTKKPAKSPGNSPPSTTTTGNIPDAVDAGFLPPNNDNHDGEGFVSYRINAKPGLPTGTRLDAEASIVFDTNEAIETPAIFNTLDVGTPTSQVTPLPTTTTPTFNVSWSGTDDGSGIAHYDIYVSKDSGQYELWLNDTTNTTAVYTGEVGHTYRFYSTAKDNVGYSQNIPTQAQAITSIIDVENPTPNQAPTLTTQISDQIATQNSPFSFTLPTNTFSDADEGDTLTYRAELEDGSAIPTWLVFNSGTSTFSGTPTNSEVGNLKVKVIAIDSQGASISGAFNLTVENINDAPTVQTPITAKTAIKDTDFNFTIPINTFIDVDIDDELTYTATLADGNALPPWLKFEAATRTFSGIPADTDIGLLSVKITATDIAGATAEDSFDLTIENKTQENPDPETPPVSSNPDQLTPVVGAKLLEVTQLNASKAVSLRIEQVGISQVSELLVFSTDALGNNRIQIASYSLLKGGQLPSDYAPEFTLDNRQIGNGKFLQFELVQNGTTRVAMPTVKDNGQIALDFGGGTRLVAAIADQPNPKNLLVDDAAAIDLTGETGPLNIEFTVYREAAFNNTVGFYTTDTADGSIQDPLTGTALRPGDATYKAAALARQLAVKLTGQNGKTSTFSSEIAGGGFLGTFLIVDGSDPLTQSVYFSYAGANANNNDHAKMLGNNTFGFEDLAGLGDRDFNDTIVQFSIV